MKAQINMAAPLTSAAALSAVAAGKYMQRMNASRHIVHKLVKYGLKTMVKAEVACLKFKGCLAGALIGDCLGEPYESDYWEELPSERQLDVYIQQLVESKVKIPYKPYTDDTAMTRCIAKSLIKKQAFDAKDMASRFVKEYFTEPRRGYGGNVVTVFGALRKQECAEPFLPARDQFNGCGSYGNGGAMRVAPVALFCHNNVDALIETARRSALITHAHREGYNGAILQCLAVHQALQADPAQELDVLDFISRLRDHMQRLEEVSDDEILDAGRSAAPYQKLLTVAEELLKKTPPPSRGSVVSRLGHDVSAVNSVPTAIYCFLRALHPLPGIQAESGVVRAIQYAISLGGDTDTVASMAGAISGAFHGMDAIPPSLVQYCEKADEAQILADQLFDLVEK